MISSKRAQLEVTFNWVYVLIAGAVILLFFAGIVVKQKAASEDNLSRMAMNIMDKIFAGARAAEKTKDFVDISGLADYTFYFDCDNEVSTYGLKGYANPKEDEVHAIFAPLELQGTRMILWSLPYKLPYKTMDFLFITTDKTKYFFVGQDEFVEEFLNATQDNTDKRKSISAEAVIDLEDITPGKTFQIRIVDVEGKIQPKALLPPPLLDKLKGYGDNKVTAVSFTGTNQVNFFQKEDDHWKQLNSNPVQIVSLGGERDAAKYAAVFAGNDKVYECNMKKAFRRLELVNEVYGGVEIVSLKPGGKLGEIAAYYQAHPELGLTGQCQSYLSEAEENVMVSMQMHQLKTKMCKLEYTKCVELIDSADKLKKANTNLAEKGDCIPLY
ncbi:hypothetical protein HZC30_00455 [Candidatus Woesearchaeota archaeon]|nr:hypothetical protein [Candidatus Woesearchaeota archaeon]